MFTSVKMDKKLFIYRMDLVISSPKGKVQLHTTVLRY